MKLHYVYRILGERGETVYIGKGKGRRLENQKRLFKADGEIIKRFGTEKAAYNYECKMIAKHSPPLNKFAGGGGALERIKEQRYVRTEQDREMERLGTQVYVARYLVTKWAAHFTEEQIADLLPVAFVQRRARIGRWKEVTG